jgi:hypothetical protein
MKTPEQIAADVLDGLDYGSDDAERNARRAVEGFRSGWLDEGALLSLITGAVEADRAQHRPEIYIVQDYSGDVVDVFRDADEATAFFQDGYSVIEETVSEPGERAEYDIRSLTRAWEEATGDTASDYQLSEDDWRMGLDDDEAARIVRLLAWKADQK